MRDLETDRLLIRALRAGDLDDFSALMARAFGGAASDEAHREQVAYGALADVVHARLKQPPYGDRAVVLRESGALVGSVGFVPCLAPFGQLPCFGGTPEARYTPEVGLFWAIQPECRGKGYATEAAAAMVRYGLDEMRLRRLVATTESDNLASIGVMRGLGMRIERNPFPLPHWFQVVGVLEFPSDNSLPDGKRNGGK
jgi:ribosomal-protein-alanine N-acetyltransferase